MERLVVPERDYTGESSIFVELEREEREAIHG
jgi:hypothetical protein